MKTEMDGCENRFCLYWQENRCQLSYITLDAPGLCENCVYLEFPEKFLRLVHESYNRRRVCVSPAMEERLADAAAEESQMGDLSQALERLF